MLMFDIFFDDLQFKMFTLIKIIILWALYKHILTVLRVKISNYSFSSFAGI